MKKDSNLKTRSWQIITLSANTEIELDQHIGNMLHFFRQYPDINLADVAYVLNLNQLNKKYCFAIIVDTVKNLIDSLEKKESKNFFYGTVSPLQKTSVVFMMPGQGSDYKFMGKQLYEKEPTFKQYLDECNTKIKKLTGIDIMESYYYSNVNIRNLPWSQRSVLTLNAILAIEYSLGKLIIDLGVTPDAIIGYSMGELSAAALSGVFTI